MALKSYFLETWKLSIKLEISYEKWKNIAFDMLEIGSAHNKLSLVFGFDALSVEQSTSSGNENFIFLQFKYKTFRVLDLHVPSLSA